MSEARPDRATLVAWLLTIVIGGGNAVGVRLTVLELDPFWGAAVRFAAAGLIFLAAMLIMRPSIGSRGSVVGALLYGVVSFAASYAFLYWGFKETPAGTGQVLIAIVPLATFVLAIAHGLERFRWRGLIGAVIALVGVAVVFADQITANVQLLSLLAVLAGAICIAEAAVIVKLTPRSHPVVTNAIGMLVGAALLAVLSLLVGERWVAPEQSRTWAAVIFLVLGGSVVVFWLYVFVLRRWTASAVSYTFLLLPLVTIVYGAIFADETITLGFVVGGAIIVVGVWIGALAPERRARPVEPIPAPVPERP